jgi:hypothetical protein
MPKTEKPTVVLVQLNQAMEMYHRGFAEISTGEVKLTAAGRKKLGKSAIGVKLFIQGTEPRAV